MELPIMPFYYHWLLLLGLMVVSACSSVVDEPVVSPPPAGMPALVHVSSDVHFVQSNPVLDRSARRCTAASEYGLQAADFERGQEP
jgi:hypothetical protein